MMFGNKFCTRQWAVHFYTAYTAQISGFVKFPTRPFSDFIVFNMTCTISHTNTVQLNMRSKTGFTLIDNNTLKNS